MKISNMLKIYISEKSAVKEILRILAQQDPNQQLAIYWHFWSGTWMEMLEVLEIYKKKVNTFYCLKKFLRDFSSIFP